MDIGRDPVATPQRIRGLSRRGAAPPDERAEPGGLLRDYEPGPNLGSIRGLHRSGLIDVSLFGSCPAERQHRILATLGLVVESLAMAPAVGDACSRHYDEHPGQDEGTRQEQCGPPGCVVLRDQSRCAFSRSRVPLGPRGSDTDVAVRCHTRWPDHSLRRVVHRLESDCPQQSGQLPHRRDRLILVSHVGALPGPRDVCPQPLHVVMEQLTGV
jgi:hypothetical protein